jgi:hypothetical protein
MADYLYCTFEDGWSTITASPRCCGTPLCRLAMGRRFSSTIGGSTRSMACPIVRSTVTSHPTPCFMMGAPGQHGSLGTTWMMPWRRLLTWCSPSCARNACRTPRTRPSCSTQFRTTPIMSGRHVSMGCAMSSRTTTIFKLQ